MSDKGKNVAGRPINIPKISSLPRILEIERALRPITQRKISKQIREFDEESTVNFIAETGIWNVVERPAKERWLEGVLIVEQSPTMRVWQDAAREMHRLLWRIGAFRRLEFFYLDITVSELRLVSPADRESYRSPHSICQFDAPRTIFLCTDSLSDGWLNGLIPSCLDSWAKLHPAIVLQMLPETMWRRTSLRHAKFRNVTSILPASIPKNVERDKQQSRDETSFIPVVPLEPEPLRSLAMFLISAAKNQVPCYSNHPSDFEEVINISTTYKVKAVEVDEVLARFLASVSPFTVDLARNLSHVPLFLPVMRIMQHVLVPDSKPAHLAELFNSGILQRRSATHIGENPDQIEYDFIPGVRDALMRQGGFPRIAKVSQVLDGYLRYRIGYGGSFLAILRDPSSAQSFVSGIHEQALLPFARVGALVLSSLGAEYSEAAKILEKTAFPRKMRIDDLKQPQELEVSDATDDGSAGCSNTEYASNIKPGIIKRIEAILGKKLAKCSAEGQPDPLVTLVSIQKNVPYKYLFDDGQLIGLNLSATELDDVKWKQIVDLLDGDAVSLQALNLSENQLVDYIMPQDLRQLKRLDLSENQLTNIALDPNQIVSLQDITLRDNPLTAPPLEIVNQGSKAVLAWYASFKKDTGVEKQYLREIKILLVGEGLAGKTSLLKKIKGLPFEKDENQTHGVNVETLELGDLPMFVPYEQVNDVKARFWDFGGQEIMHSSHQFFLTHRSIYVFVLDSRTDNKQHYWLRHIQKFGGGSPAIIAINKMDDNPGYSLEENSLNKKYPFIDNRFIKLSCKTGKGLDTFAQTLAELIHETVHFKTPISESWRDIKDKLESETSKEKYIDHKRFLEICEQYGEAETAAQDALLKYLHTLGVVLHFPGLSLQEFYILDPHWVTIGVYKINNSPSIIDGVLEEKDLEFILNEEQQKLHEYDPNKEKSVKYSSKEQSYLVSIMEKFELLYKYEEGCYLVPDLLPKEPEKPIQLDWEHPVTFIMDYDFLPTNIISQFIISMIEDVASLKQLWRTGVLLTSKIYECKALVIANTERKRLTIMVVGETRRKRDYFSVIHHCLCTINKKFSDLNVTEKLPVPGHIEIEVDYEELLGYERAGRDEYFIGKLGKDFSVSGDFLDKFSAKGKRIKGQADVKTKITLGVPGIGAVENEIPWNHKKVGRWFQQILQKFPSFKKEK